MKRNSIFKSHKDIIQTNGGKKSQKGQGMTEYLAATALIAVGSIATLGYFGEAIQGSFASLGAEIAGDNATSASAKTLASTNSKSAKAAAEEHKSLDNYQETTEKQY